MAATTTDAPGEQPGGVAEGGAGAAAETAPGSLQTRNLDLEGLRAVAAIAVLVTHVSLNAMGNEGPFGGLLARLDVGVAVFFVLSGYLLYRPFVRALLRDDALPSVRRYFRHRLLRIVPAYWVVVLASFLFAPATGLVMPTTGFSAAAVGETSVPFSQLLRFLTFTQVYWRDSLAGPFPQAWTLATEMAFYLFLPVLVLAVARRQRARGGDRRTRVRRQWLVLGGMVVAAQAYRLAMVLLTAPYRSGADARTSITQLGAWLPNHLDMFAAGMALAVLAVEREDGGPGAVLGRRLDGVLARRGMAWASVGIGLLVLLLAGYGLGLSRTDLSYGRSGEFLRHGAYLAVALALVLPAVFGRAGDGGYRRFLRTRPMQFLGRISYGIYLWQILVIGRWVSSPFTPGGPLPARHPGGQFNVPFWSTLAWTLAVTVVLATISYYVVERPALRYRDRPMGFFVAGLWTVSLVSLATRIWSFATVNARDPGNGDPFYYHAQANMLADRVGFGEPIQWLTQGRFVPSAIHPPLFTIWLSLASWVGARGYLSHKVMAAFAGVAVVVVAALLARRLAGDRAGVIAAGLVALYPNLWIIDGTLWPEGLYTALVGGALVLAYRWRDRPTLWGAAAVGAAVGGAILTRGEAILLLPALCVPLAIAGRKVATRWWLHGLVMCGVAAALVAPWTLRNLLRFEKVVPVSTNSEEVLFYANCPETYSGPLVGYWSFNCQEQARKERVAQGLPADPPGDESERAAGWGALGRQYAKAHRDRWPAVATARVLRAWDLHYSGTTARALQFEGRPYTWTRRALVMWWLMLVPAAIGFVLLRRRRVPIWPLASMLGVVTATALAVYGHPRFRTVGDLVVIVTAAVAIDALLARRFGAAPAFAMTTPDPASTALDADTDASSGGRPGDGPAGAEGLVEGADGPDPDPDQGSGGPADWSRRRWRDWRSWVAVAIVGAAIAIPLRALMRYQGPPMEEGFMLVFPERILHGDMPHKDFLHLYGPGSLWALAAWFKVVGVSITSERVFGLAQLATMVFGVVALAWPWGRRVAATAGVFGVLLTMTAIGLTALAWDGAVALLVVATWLGLRARRWITEPPPANVADEADPDADADAEAVPGPDPGAAAARSAARLLTAAGAFAGAALLFRPDVIVAVTCSTLAVLAGLGWARWKRWLLGAVPVVSLYLVHLALSGPGNAIRGMFIEPVFSLRGGRSLPRPPSWDTFDGALQKVALLRPQPWPLPSLASPHQAFIWFFLLPIATFFVVGVGWWRVRSAPEAWKPRVVLTVGLLGLGLMPQAFQRADTTHLAWVSCVTLAFLPVALAELFAHLPSRPVRRLAPNLAVLVVALLPLVVIPHFTARTYVDLAKQSANGKVFGYPVTYRGRTFYLGAKDIAPVAQRMLEEVGPQMQPGDRVLVGTADLRKTPYSDAYLYYLLPDQVPGTRYIEMDPGMANAPDSGLADEVRTSDWLILSHVWDAWSEPNDSRKFGPDEPNRVVKDHFCSVGDYQPYFEVYRRCR
ncbi:MAG: acyltransferase [Acidimicrobiales bacterium]